MNANFVESTPYDDTISLPVIGPIPVSDGISATSLILSEKIQTDLVMLSVVANAPQVGVTASNANDGSNGSVGFGGSYGYSGTGSSGSSGVGSGSGNSGVGSGTDVPDKYLDPMNYPNSGTDLLTEIYDMVDQMRNNSNDPDRATRLAAFLSSLLNPDVLKKFPQLFGLLNSTHLQQEGGASLYDLMIDYMVEKEYYRTGGNLELVKTYITKLKLMFPISNGDPITLEINEKLNMMNNDDFLKEFDIAHRPILLQGEDVWGFQLAVSWAKELNQLDIPGWKREVRLKAFDYLKAGNMNAFILCMILMAMLQDNSSTEKVGCYGGTANWLKDRTDDLTKLMNQFKKGFATNEEAKAFIDGVVDFNIVCRDPRGIGIKDTINKQLGLSSGLLSIKVGPVTWTDKAGKTWTDTKTLFEWSRITDSKDTDSPLLKALKLCYVDTTDPTKTNPLYIQMDREFSSVSGAVTFQSTTQTQLLSQLSSSIDVNINFIKTCLSGESGVVAGESASVKNQKS
jgi:uncharacterized protein YfkK (UPF0435 family)